MKASLIAAFAIAETLAEPLAALDGPAPMPVGFQAEKCYGIAKAASTTARPRPPPGPAPRSNDVDHVSWIYVPAGSCAKIASGSTMPMDQRV